MSGTGTLRVKDWLAIKFFLDHIVEAESNSIEITLWHGCSPVNLLHIFRTPFSRNTSGWLLLILLTFSHILLYIFQWFFIFDQKGIGLIEAATGGVLWKKVFVSSAKICLRPASLLKKWLRHRYFPVKFAKYLRIPSVAASSLSILKFLTLSSTRGSLISKVVISSSYFCIQKNT